MDLLDKLRGALGAFVDELTALRRELESLLQQRENVLSQPAARADVVSMLHQWADLERQQFLEALGQRLRRDIAQPRLDLATPESVHRLTASQYLGVTAAGAGGNVTAGAVDSVVAGLFAGLLKSSLAAAVAELPWPDKEGPPMAERVKRLAALDSKIDALKQREAELLKVASQSGVTID